MGLRLVLLRRDVVGKGKGGLSACRYFPTGIDLQD
jgi:hypothetical protein